jgi:hypothetical protein
VLPRGAYDYRQEPERDRGSAGVGDTEAIRQISLSNVRSIALCRESEGNLPFYGVIDGRYGLQQENEFEVSVSF